MNLIEENNQIETNKKSYKGLIITIVIVVLLLIATTVALIYLLNEEDKKTLKLYIDTNQLTTISKNMFYEKNGLQYVSIKEIAGVLGYRVYNGGYKEYTESGNECYIEIDEEVASFTANEKEFFKVNPKVNDDYQYFDLKEKIEEINGTLYISISDLGTVCNVSLTKEGNNISILTLEYLAEQYKLKYEDAMLEKFEDMKTILYGVMVVSNKSNNYGLISLAGETIIGSKYKKISFKESNQEFYVTTAENKQGIISLEGNIIIPPNYDEIINISRESNLYVVRNEYKYGVINSKNNIVVYIEYDDIGIKNPNQFSSVKNQYLIYDSMIPVYKNGKWGIVSVSGEFILQLEYDGFGCTSVSKSNGGKSILLIEEYESVVVKKDDYYGIINKKGEFLVPLGLSSIYYTVNSGVKTISMVYQEQILDVLDYLKELYLVENESINEITAEDLNNLN